MENLLPLIKTDRLIAIEGELGTGKTSLAFRLGYELLKRDFVQNLTSNIPNIWNTLPENWELDKNDQINTVCILDEAGIFLSSRKEAKKYMMGLRKINAVMLFPSKEEISRKASRIFVTGIMNFQAVGIPLWTYKWVVKGTDDKGKLYWWKPQEIFGTYSTKSFPLSDGGISQSLENVLLEIGDDITSIYKAKKQKTISRKSIYSDDEKTRDDYLSEMAELTERFEAIVQEAEIRPGKLSIHKRKTRQ